METIKSSRVQSLQEFFTNIHFPTFNKIRFETNKKALHPEILDQGILCTLEQQVRENLFKYEFAEETIDDIIQEIVYQRQTKIQKLHSVIKILATNSRGTKLKTAFYREVHKIIQDIEIKTAAASYQKYILNQIIGLSAEQKNTLNQATAAYLLYNLKNDTQLLRSADKLEYFIRNYNKYISPSIVDEWDISKTTDENGGNVEAPRKSTVIKISDSIATKIQSGLELNELRDIVRTAIDLDELFEESVIADDKQVLVGQHYNHTLNKLLAAGFNLEQISVSLNKYSSGYSDIKIRIILEDGKNMEVQSYPRSIMEAKKAEEAAGLYPQRKELISDLVVCLSQCDAFEEIQKGNTSPRKDLQNILAYLHTESEYTQQLVCKNSTASLIGLNLLKIKSALEKLPTQTQRQTVIENIHQLALKYQNSLNQSRAYFAKDAIFQTQAEAQKIVEQFSSELQSVTKIKIYD